MVRAAQGRSSAGWQAMTAMAAMLFGCLPLQAAELEFKRAGGLSLSRFSVPPGMVTIPEAALSLEDRVLVLFGIGFVYKMTPRFSLDVSGQYFRKGTHVDYRLYDQPVGKYIYDLRVLSLPVCLRYGFFPKSTPYVLGGFEISHVVSHEMKYYPDGQMSGLAHKLINSTRKFDFALVIGAGGELVFGRFVIFTEIRWYSGLVNISRSIENYPVIKTRVLSFQFGYRTKRKPFPFD